MKEMKLRLKRGTLASYRDDRKNQEQGYGVGDDHEWRMKGKGVVLWCLGVK